MQNTKSGKNIPYKFWLQKISCINRNAKRNDLTAEFYFIED